MWCTSRFNIQQLYALPTLYYVFCIYLGTNCDLCHLHHKLIGFITEMKSVYSAVRTGSLNKAVRTSSCRVKAQLHSFITLAPDECEWLTSHLGQFTAGVHWIWGWRAPALSWMLWGKGKILTVPGNWLKIAQLSSLQPVTILTCLPAPLAAVATCWKLSQQWDLTSIQSASLCCDLTLQVRWEHCCITDIALMHSSFSIPLETWPCVKIIITSLHVWRFFSKQHTKSVTRIYY
jgi:hypothetical protein